MLENSVLLSGLVALLGAVFALGCSHGPPPAAPVSARVWSDAELLDYVLVARERVGSGSMSVVPGSRVLGQHNGTTLVQTVKLNDFVTGPEDFAIVVHYKLAKGSDCTDVGGVSKSLRVPNWYSSSIRQFCFPGVLAEHWAEVAPKMTPLRPFDSFLSSR
jgi:hypothetical protein